MSLMIPRGTPVLSRSLMLGASIVPHLTVTAAPIQPSGVKADVFITLESDYQRQSHIDDRRTHVIEETAAIIDNAGSVVKRLGKSAFASLWRDASHYTALFHDALQMAHSRRYGDDSAGELTREHATRAIAMGLVKAAADGHRSVCINPDFSLYYSLSEQTMYDHLDPIACFNLVLSAIAMYASETHAGAALALEDIVIPVSDELFDHFSHLIRTGRHSAIFASLSITHGTGLASPDAPSAEVTL